MIGTINKLRNKIKDLKRRDMLKSSTTRGETRRDIADKNTLHQCAATPMYTATSMYTPASTYTPTSVFNPTLKKPVSEEELSYQPSQMTSNTVGTI
ncbi:hypothetical protein ACF0H5_024299 [Mactra antiquata]